MPRADIFFPSINDIRCTHCSRNISEPETKCPQCRCYIHPTCVKDCPAE